MTLTKKFGDNKADVALPLGRAPNIWDLIPLKHSVPKLVGVIVE